MFIYFHLFLSYIYHNKRLVYDSAHLAIFFVWKIYLTADVADVQKILYKKIPVYGPVGIVITIWAN